jgi:hypothetical protein
LQRPGRAARQQAPASSVSATRWQPERAFLGHEDLRRSPVQSNALASSTAIVSPHLHFVCEGRRRLAIKKGQKPVVAERAIITPAARELGEAHKVLTMAPWRT